MDTSEKYILMCEKAEEVQKEWRPDIGDYIDPCRVVSVITSLYQPDDECCLIGTNNVNLYGQMHPQSMYFWLPRQDQLQEMLASEEGTMEAPLQQLRGFVYRVNLKRGYYEQFSKSYEQLWLAFVMYEKYQKRWDEEKGEWNALCC